MYAVIETGGKQYRVEPGDVIEVEHLQPSGKKADQVEFDRVLMINSDKDIRVGRPLVTGAKVTGKLLEEVRSPKVLVFKMKRRKGYRRRRGHRQDLMRVRIEKIKG
jgi:large subunit ribosomal protein L21